MTYANRHFALLVPQINTQEPLAITLGGQVVLAHYAWKCTKGKQMAWCLLKFKAGKNLGDDEF